MVHSAKMGGALKILERMVNQNAEDEIFQDFKYWEVTRDNVCARERYPVVECRMPPAAGTVTMPLAFRCPGGYVDLTLCRWARYPDCSHYLSLTDGPPPGRF